MKTVSATICLCLLLLPAISATLRAQSRKGTVEASWDNAVYGDPIRTAPATPERDVVPPRMHEAPGATAWDVKRSGMTRPWPVLPANPTFRDYHYANTMVIDSLSHLYCLSPGYVTTLRSRNDGAWQAVPEGKERDFNYNDSGRHSTREANRPSLQALYKELLQLLDRCLAGR